MRTKVLKVINLSNFFNIAKSNNKKITYTYKEASIILLHNIRARWLQFIYAKTSQHFPVYLNEHKTKTVIKNQPCGFIHQVVPQFNQEHLVEYDLENLSTKTTSELHFNMIVPIQDVMQYFMQWQRYRKYWWSSVTTTPSLFSLSDIKHKENSANVDVLANFNWGSKIVEAVSIDTDTESSYLRCKMSLEDALFTLLLDGLNNSTKEEYLRLHNKMAPYKIALALEYDDSKYFDTLKELAALMMHKLEQKNISTICPNVELPLNSQLRENFKIGVTYTAIISENTLSNGIFHLLNSSTMLKEQIHLADFESYATLLCGK
ncbi:DNA polymerase subunit gamma-2, mitochondrial isoform X2 [Papilio machaon]|uniref:DNA polymerase subunit gamma-2, mitochondrial isoform X2 n=1 Tax=Papilio machaon TaxID=76193 RepID=UPI001E66446B|nr:DNA polymerase subunit gamma-2, mitochondrial isoform X2 [Papilio machaon]